MQNSGPWDPWLPVVENSRLFRTARGAPPVYYTCLLRTLGLALEVSMALGPPRLRLWAWLWVQPPRS